MMSKNDDGINKPAAAEGFQDAAKPAAPSAGRSARDIESEYRRMASDRTDWRSGSLDREAIRGNWPP